MSEQHALLPSDGAPMNVSRTKYMLMFHPSFTHLLL
jgi:hypothetical protein